MKKVTRIDLTDNDVRQAIAEYVVANGLASIVGACEVKFLRGLGMVMGAYVEINDGSD